MSIQVDDLGVEFADPNDYEAVREIMRGWIRDTALGGEFLDQYGGKDVAEGNLSLLRQQIDFHSYNVSFQTLNHVFVTLRDSGQLQGNTDDRAEVDADRPRTKDGRLMSDSQIAWSEMTKWSLEHTTDECRQRARRDHQYAEFMRINSERERYRDGGLRLVGQNASTPTISDAERQRLSRFAAEFLLLPADEARRKMSPAFNPGGWREFKQNFEAACAQNLI